MAKKYCYLFTEGNATMRNLLGGKGANLAEMTNIGLPVPQGFTISTEACTQYYEDGRQINPEIQAEIMEYVDKMEKICGKKFGDKERPAPRLRPFGRTRIHARHDGYHPQPRPQRRGRRDHRTEVEQPPLGLGLLQKIHPDVLRRRHGSRQEVLREAHRRDEGKEGVTQDVELTADDLKELANQFKAEYKNQLGKDFPSDPKEQLFEAIKAVFRSWDNPRANIYRMDHDIPYSWGTAVNVQMMAFGNMGDQLRHGRCLYAQSRDR